MRTQSGPNCLQCSKKPSINRDEQYMTAQRFWGRATVVLFESSKSTYDGQDKVPPLSKESDLCLFLLLRGIGEVSPVVDPLLSVLCVKICAVSALLTFKS